MRSHGKTKKFSHRIFFVISLTRFHFAGKSRRPGLRLKTISSVRLPGLRGRRMRPLELTAGVEPQFVRWRGQLQLPETDPAEMMKDVETLTLKGLTGQWIEIKSDTETILGMIASYKDKLWVFKYRSSNSTAEVQRAAFRSFCESLNVE